MAAACTNTNVIHLRFLGAAERETETGMDIKSSFLSALEPNPRFPCGKKPADFLGHTLLPEEQAGSPLLYLLSCGEIQALSPWAFDICPMDCCLFLYTRSGCGKLTVNSQVHSLAESSFLFFDCRQRFRFDIAVSPWTYQVAFFHGSPLSYYCKLLSRTEVPVIHVAPASEIAVNMGLLAARAADFRPCHQLAVSDSLNHMVTICLSELLNGPAPVLQIPAYIKNMKTLFDENYKELYTLDCLEERFGISKYRLCREFKSAYNMPPLQYLNKTRIARAACLLQSTGYKIHEIGSMVGIENTNHFISLFKKQYGVTPSAYRQRGII